MSARVIPNSSPMHPTTHGRIVAMGTPVTEAEKHFRRRWWHSARTTLEESRHD